jgi:hypothetical protein
MAYLYGYFGTGLVFLVVILTSHQLTKFSCDTDVSDLVLAANANSGKWWWRPLNKVVIPVLAAILVVVAWPIAIYWKAKEMGQLRKQEPKTSTSVIPQKREFEVSSDQLNRCCALDEIERHETVVDPLNAAPRIPFGHLNRAWLRFKEQIGSGDTVWSFSASWNTEWGRKELREGYVIVRGNRIGLHFQTMWLSDTGPGPRSAGGRPVGAAMMP